jgi:tetraacyldisaccharide 4'-kinase
VTLKESLLWPLSLPYGAVSHLRARAYRKGILKPRRLDGVVISVGNLTTGGTGKTPMVLRIAEHLIAEGKRVGILTRGYRGTQSPSVSATNSQAPPSTSDEVRLLHGRLRDRASIGVGANRYKRGRELAARGVNWFILDDGFQHLQLARDVNILLIDATNPFGGGRLLPVGLLREPRSALARADIIVITRSAYAPAIESAIRRDSNAPIFYARPKLDSIRRVIDVQPAGALTPAETEKLFAFCGIGNPQAFLADLREWGFQIVGQKFFPDHHRFTQRDQREILRAATAAGATALICTEKDLYNLPAARTAELPAFFCSITLQIDREEEFWRTLMNFANSRSPESQANSRMQP